MYVQTYNIEGMYYNIKVCHFSIKFHNVRTDCKTLHLHNLLSLWLELVINNNNNNIIVHPSSSFSIIIIIIVINSTITIVDIF